jgi:hypothetical protein
VNSVETPREKREEAWGHLAKDLDLAKLDIMASHARLDDVPSYRNCWRKVRGRVVVDL